ncbi:MAG: hypothetical protein SFU56_19370 [Capsulimonadales bacterium]|nr:hypothetical protein [Capsulimonadales bacterium]
MSRRTKTDTSDLPLRQQPWSEAQFRERARADGLCLAPVVLRLADEATLPTGDTIGDGVFVATWGERRERFVAEYKSLGTPKAVETAVAQARLWSEKTGIRPLVIAPYLSEESLRRLEGEGVSGVDLCGNGVLLAADFSVFRGGAPNRFRSSQPIRNVYRGTSSLFARALLLRPAFDSLRSLQSFARDRVVAPDDAAQLVKGTASKVVQSLEEDLIVRREGRGGVRLSDPARLLDRLRENYRKPSGARIEGKTALSPADVWQRLRTVTSGDAAGRLRAVATGEGSVGRYGLLSGPDRLSLYVSDPDEAARLLEVRPTRVFPDVELVETDDETVYFDAR